MCILFHICIMHSEKVSAAFIAKCWQIINSLLKLCYLPESTLKYKQVLLVQVDYDL